MLHAHESQLIKLGKRISKIHPLVRYSLARIHNLYILYRVKSFRIKVFLSKKIFGHPKDSMVNLGAGHWYKRGWTVLDFESEWYSENKLFIDYHYDLTKRERMPFADGSVDLFYSSHTFEHVSGDDCIHAIGEIYRSLKTGGVLRITVPDLNLIYEMYKNGEDEFFQYYMKAYNATLTQAFMSLFARPRMNEGDEIIRSKFIALNKVDFLNYYTHDLKQKPEVAGYHINWFNSNKWEDILRQAGFTEIYKSTRQGSRFKELRSKDFDSGMPDASLYVEAIK